MAFRRVICPGVRYSKCGVMLTDLTAENEHQGDFLTWSEGPPAGHGGPKYGGVGKRPIFTGIHRGMIN
jgi:hypothetical protein